MTLSRVTTTPKWIPTPRRDLNVETLLEQKNGVKTLRYAFKYPTYVVTDTPNQYIKDLFI